MIWYRCLMLQYYFSLKLSSADLHQPVSVPLSRHLDVHFRVFAEEAAHVAHQLPQPHACAPFRRLPSEYPLNLAEGQEVVGSPEEGHQQPPLVVGAALLPAAAYQYPQVGIQRVASESVLRPLLLHHNHHHLLHVARPATLVAVPVHLYLPSVLHRSSFVFQSYGYFISGQDSCSLSPLRYAVCGGSTRFAPSTGSRIVAAGEEWSARHRCDMYRRQSVCGMRQTVPCTLATLPVQPLQCPFSGTGVPPLSHERSCPIVRFGDCHSSPPICARWSPSLSTGQRLPPTPQSMPHRIQTGRDVPPLPPLPAMYTPRHTLHLPRCSLSLRLCGRGNDGAIVDPAPWQVHDTYVPPCQSVCHV